MSTMSAPGVQAGPEKNCTKCKSLLHSTSPHPAVDPVQSRSLRVEAFINGRCRPTDGETARTTLARVIGSRGRADQLHDLQGVRLSDERRPRLASWIVEATDAIGRRDALVLDMWRAFHKGDVQRVEDYQKALEAMKYDENGSRRVPVGIGILGPCGGENGKAYHLLDIDIDIENIDTAWQNAFSIENSFLLDPHVLAWWQSRRGIGWHALLLCDADGASIESARSYILSKWPKADPAAISINHTILTFFGFDKGAALPFGATEDEKAAYRAKNEQERAERARRDQLRGDASGRQLEAIFASYMGPNGLRADCTSHLSHADMLHRADRCGCILRDTGHTDDGTIMECARIIYEATKDVKGRPRETLGAVVRAIKWGIEKGTYHIELQPRRAK